jgi:uncharacterized paraquat-inducible protein A
LSLEECSRKCNVPDLSKSRSLACPRCKTTMAEVVRIAPVVHEAGFWCLVMPSASEREAVVVMGRMHNLVLLALLGLAA